MVDENDKSIWKDDIDPTSLSGDWQIPAVAI
jgi:hypothetical protein